MCLIRFLMLFRFYEEASMVLLTLLSHVALLVQYSAHVAIWEQSLY